MTSSPVRSLKWYFYRFSVMSGCEVLFRAWEYVHKLAVGAYYSMNWKRDPELSPDSGDYQSDLGLLRTYSFFGYRYPLKDLDWHLDFVSGERFPLIQSRKINIRNYEGARAKMVWELNRQQFLVDYRPSPKGAIDRGYLQDLKYIIQSWDSQNPYLMGINWYSNIEVNLRLLTWYLVWQESEFNEMAEENSSYAMFLNGHWLPLIHRHCQFSRSFPSRFSSSNNHRVAELSGLFVAATFWRFSESEKWSEYARTHLEKEMVTQNSANGVNREEAAGYVQFVTDLFLLPYIVSLRINKPFSQGFKTRLRGLFYYIYHMLDMNGHHVNYGDSDDGFVISTPETRGANNFRSLLTSGAVLFHDPVLKSRSQGFDDKNMLLFGEGGRRAYSSMPAIYQPRESAFYVDEGHFYYRKEEPGHEILLHFDAAPLGFLSTAAHGHADALSITLNVDGEPILVDPGTYTYHSEPEWRNYFAGTLAHNTIRVDGLDQAVRGGPTLWLKHFRCRVLEHSKGEHTDYVRASHDGYRRLGVTHVRSVLFDRDSSRFQFEDRIETSPGDKHLLEIPFHLHPDVEISRIGRTKFVLKRNGSRLVRILLDEQNDITISNGQVNPILGWYSPAFYRKLPAPVILCTLHARGSCILRTTIEIVE